MPSRFEECLKFCRKWEGGKIDHSADPGGRTAYGITKEVYDRYRIKTGRPVRDVLASELTSERVNLSRWRIVIDKTKRLLNDPSKSVDAGAYRGTRNFSDFSPFFNGERHPSASKESVGAFVVPLFFASSPFAVVRRVPFVVVNALNSHPFRALPHIGKKVVKVEPPITNGHTSAAVPGVAIVRMVRAASLHASPRVIGWRDNASDGMPVRATSLSDQVFSKASARLCVSVLQVATYDDNESAAVADTKPLSLTRGVMPEGFYRGKATEFLPGKLEGLRGHSALLNVSTLLGAWQMTVRSLFGSYPSHARAIVA